MTDLLENELIKKYFGCNLDGLGHEGSLVHSCIERIAYNILRAMQEELVKGDRYLQIEDERHITEKEVGVDEYAWTVQRLTFHPFFLRLPDKFQTKPCCCSCTCHERTK